MNVFHIHQFTDMIIFTISPLFLSSSSMLMNFVLDLPFADTHLMNHRATLVLGSYGTKTIFKSVLVVWIFKMHITMLFYSLMLDFWVCLSRMLLHIEKSQLEMWHTALKMINGRWGCRLFKIIIYDVFSPHNIQTKPGLQLSWDVSQDTFKTPTNIEWQYRRNNTIKCVRVTIKCLFNTTDTL